LGTFMFGLVNQLFGSLRMGILSVIIFFLLGLLILPFVNVNKSMREARQNNTGLATLPES
jgi:UMF1 family MFS transporter